MIKRIIFDIDDTVLPFPKEFEDGYKKVINKYNLEIGPKELYRIIGEYETSGKYKYYDKKDLLDLINNKLNINLDNNFVKDFFDMYNNLGGNVSKDTIDTLEYLSKKYELVGLSNWFTESQKARLKNTHILKFFDEIYGTDIVPMKPNKESFLCAIGDNKLSECVMIGDSLDVDIKVPYEMGMKVYYFTNKKTDYPSIKKISDLKELL